MLIRKNIIVFKDIATNKLITGTVTYTQIYPYLSQHWTYRSCQVEKCFSYYCWSLSYSAAVLYFFTDGFHSIFFYLSTQGESELRVTWGKTFHKPPLTPATECWGMESWLVGRVMTSGACVSLQLCYETATLSLNSDAVHNRAVYLLSREKKCTFSA